MKRKILSVALAAVLLLSLLAVSSCGKTEEPEDGTPVERTCLIKADYASDTPADSLELIADEGEYAARVLLTPETAVEKFAFFALTFDDMDGDTPVFSTSELYSLDRFEPDKPLVVSMTFGETMPTYGFTYKNEDGLFKTYGLSLSGEDGSVVVSEVKAPLG